MKIVVVGLGYVGLSNAVLLAQHSEVIGVDISEQRVSALNARQSPIIDTELSEYLAKKDLNLSASTDVEASVRGANYVIVSTPTNYDEQTNSFDTSSVEAVIAQVIRCEPKACVVVKSTIPVGFIDNVRVRLGTDAVIFSPEFLREGKALYDNLYPSRIVVGEKSKRAEVFAGLMVQCALKKNVDVLLTGAREAEAIKLFSNTYLAMRIAFFNELDSYALAGEMNSREIIDGVSLDPRIGPNYNNPSFGFGGYCLPKDTKQLRSSFGNIPNALVKSLGNSNRLRKKHIVNDILKLKCRNIGIYLLAMKKDSDNFRESSIIDIIKLLRKSSKNIFIYEPLLNEKKTIFGCDVLNDFEKFLKKSDIIITNRHSHKLNKVSNQRG